MVKNQASPEKLFAKPIGGFHGVSAIFPKLKDIIGYEEGNILVNRGYPRFVTHPSVKEVEEIHKKRYGAKAALCCHSFEAAIFLVVDFLIQNETNFWISKTVQTDVIELINKSFPGNIKITDISDAVIMIKDVTETNNIKKVRNKVIVGIASQDAWNMEGISDIFDIVIFHDKKRDIGIILLYAGLKFLSNRTIVMAELIVLRRHAGLIASSRKTLQKKKISSEKIKIIEENLKSNISGLEFSNSKECLLFPSGMAAVFAALYSLFSPQRNKFISLGSLYVDSLRILEKWPKKLGLEETLFVRKNYEEELSSLIDEKTAGVIFEFPTNPLLELVDVDKIVTIAHSNGAKVICDSTVATPYNFNPFKHDIDIIVHSTTKFLSGKNNHIGGLLLARDEKLFKKIEHFKNTTNLDMCFDDMKVLSRNIKKFEKRMVKINENTLEIANFLSTEKNVKQVYYPLLKSDPNYNLSKKYLKGGSGVLSFTFTDSSYSTAEKFYDNLKPPILKGPSLGSEKTLLSPYVIMAHYNDSEEDLKRFGFDLYLMRISVGIEPVDKIIKSLENGFKYLS
ncbi:MAG: PLP-dependent transferase [Promethearchaeota archaeon]|jgi:cystathionine beta-lyase/cystathionine gamma-synthase